MKEAIDNRQSQELPPLEEARADFPMSGFAKNTLIYIVGQLGKLGDDFPIRRRDPAPIGRGWNGAIGNRGNRCGGRRQHDDACPGRVHQRGDRAQPRKQ